MAKHSKNNIISYDEAKQKKLHEREQSDSGRHFKDESQTHEDVQDDGYIGDAKTEENEQNTAIVMKKSVVIKGQNMAISPKTELTEDPNTAMMMLKTLMIHNLNMKRTMRIYITKKQSRAHLTEGAVQGT